MRLTKLKMRFLISKDKSLNCNVAILYSRVFFPVGFTGRLNYKERESVSNLLLERY